MQSTFPAVARQIRLHEEIKGRDGEIEARGREVGGGVYVLGCESRCHSGPQWAAGNLTEISSSMTANL